jgi:hypothetical protein
VEWVTPLPRQPMLVYQLALLSLKRSHAAVLMDIKLDV